jgi:hypothetical protein
VDVFVEVPAVRLSRGDSCEFARLSPQKFRDVPFNLMADLGVVQRCQQLRLVDVRKTTAQRTFH